MIRLYKRPAPDILVQNAGEWTRELLTVLEEGRELTHAQRYRYRHQDIKTTLIEETYNKCAYCESKCRHVHSGEIDHIIPFSERPDLFVEWKNLTFTCKECNHKKGAYFSDVEPIVQPYEDDPEDHFWFCGPLMLEKDEKGFRTAQLLRLSRMALVEKRGEAIEKVNLLIRRWLELPDGETKGFVKQQIVAAAAAEAEFSATIRGAIVQRLGWDPWEAET